MQRQGDAHKGISRGIGGQCDGDGGGGAVPVDKYLASHTFEFVPSCTEDAWVALLLLKTRELQGAHLTVELAQAYCRKMRSRKAGVSSNGFGHSSPQAAQSWALALTRP